MYSLLYLKEKKISFVNQSCSGSSLLVGELRNISSRMYRLRGCQVLFKFGKLAEGIAPHNTLDAMMCLKGKGFFSIQIYDLVWGCAERFIYNISKYNMIAITKS